MSRPSLYNSFTVHFLMLGWVVTAGAIKAGHERNVSGSDLFCARLTGVAWIGISQGCKIGARHTVLLLVTLLQGSSQIFT